MTLTKPQSNVETWTYDRRDLVISHTRGYGDPGASTVEFEYDDNANLVTQEDGRNYDTTYTWDLFDRRTKTTNALCHYEKLTLDKAGHVTEVARYDSTRHAAPGAGALLRRARAALEDRGPLQGPGDELRRRGDHDRANEDRRAAPK